MLFVQANTQVKCHKRMQNFTIPQAREEDLHSLGRLGASLVQTHFAFDPQRFIAPESMLAEGYAYFLGHEMKNPDAVIFVAERESTVVGYVYGGIEPHSWKELRAE